jgi:hypothetical protein
LKQVGHAVDIINILFAYVDHAVETSLTECQVKYEQHHVAYCIDSILEKAEQHGHKRDMCAGFFSLATLSTQVGHTVEIL